MKQIKRNPTIFALIQPKIHKHCIVWCRTKTPSKRGSLLKWAQKRACWSKTSLNVGGKCKRTRRKIRVPTLRKRWNITCSKTCILEMLRINTTAWNSTRLCSISLSDFSNLCLNTHAERFSKYNRIPTVKRESKVKPPYGFTLVLRATCGVRWRCDLQYT